MAERQISLVVNGASLDLSIPDDETLVHTLRDRLGLRSVRPTCGIGICGTCTVQVERAVVSSCLLLTRQVAGRAIVTSEGLIGDDGELSRIQQAFVDHGAYQCSYCIPGMVMTVDACLSENPDAGLGEVREYLAGNLCRCGTYVSILEAVSELVGDPRSTGVEKAEDAWTTPT
jgi:aerobic-type carbon monoxide dehydrogenase small subunit (CoxS/CutS family)